MPASSADKVIFKVLYKLRVQISVLRSTLLTLDMRFSSFATAASLRLAAASINICSVRPSFRPFRCALAPHPSDFRRRCRSAPSGPRLPARPFHSPVRPSIRVLRRNGKASMAAAGSVRPNFGQNISAKIRPKMYQQTFNSFITLAEFFSVEIALFWP